MRPLLRGWVRCVAAGVIAVGVPAVAAPASHADEAQPDLVVSSLPTSSPKPGETYDQAVTITNNGTAAASDVTFRVRLTRGLDFTAPEKGCTYTVVADQVRQALCKLDQVIEPGGSVTAPVRFAVSSKGLLEVVEYGTGRTGQPPGSEGFDDSYRRLALTVDSTADLVAVGDEATAEAGELVKVTATLRNDGPGWIHNQESDDQPGLLVRIPKGTKAVQVPQECAPFGIDGPTGPSEPGHPVYVCWHSDNLLEVGQSLGYLFGLKVTSASGQTRGEVKATSVYDIPPAFDKNHANDTAYLTLHVPTRGGSTSSGSSGGSGAGGSGSGGQGNGNDPRGQSVGGSSSGGAQTSSSGSVTDGAAGDLGTVPSRGRLAGTGTGRSVLVAAIGAAALVGGGSTVLLFRRRSATS
ncbi:CARDB domain-containing protein [Streptomyces sp. NPDC050523]|uniref:CARDB domain-containing protein n=1 Tax=Streptomyces sp. NPDC050523 TaxID=3365622 RepID=UPI003788357E